MLGSSTGVGGCTDETFFVILKGAALVFQKKSAQKVGREWALYHKLMEHGEEAMGENDVLSKDGLQALVSKKSAIFDPYLDILGTIDRIMYKKIIYKSEYLKNCLVDLNAREVDPSAKLFDGTSGILGYEYLKTLYKGQNYGEINILSHRGLACTICIASEDYTECCWLDRREYSGIFLEAEHVKIQRKLKFFHETVFRGFGFDSGIQTILHLYHKDFFLKNEILYKQNSKPEFLYVVIKGWVKLYCLVDGGKFDYRDKNEL